ncbi:MAG: GntR family transcriptional regulator [Bacteroidota bacterium]
MEFKQKQAIYMQIADYIIENILADRWKAGEKILSVRELATNIQVNPNTVMRTYSFLQEQGIIFNKRGIGYFVAEDALEKTREIRKTDFVDQYLPFLFKTMDLIGLSFDDLQTFYHTYHHENKQ